MKEDRKEVKTYEIKAYCDGGTAIFGRSFEAIAQRVYQMADATLEAREKKE